MTPFGLDFDSVTFRYSRSRLPALSGVTLSLGEGIVGLIGPNGAGKSTLLKLILGLLEPDEGSIRICGRSPTAFRRERGLGFIPETASFPDHLTVGEFLDALRALAGSGESDPEEQTLESLMAIGEIAGFRLGELSLGQKRRVEVAAALQGGPDLLLLDEPTNGLDPLALDRFRALVRGVRRPGRLILISSHHLDELERLVERVVVMSEGKVQGNWSTDQVRRDAGSFEAHFLQTVRTDER